MTIGIPRALIYWKKPYFWEVFFEVLGFKVVLSPKTNKRIVDIGVKVSDPETCFSNKVYWGHFLWLEGKCDMIFVPRLRTNEEKLEYCLRFFALPDLAKILTKTPILTQTFDGQRERFEKTIQRLGKSLNKKKKEIERALFIASSKEKAFKREKKERFLKKIQMKGRKIVLVSHPYNLYDDYVNSRIEEKLEKLGVVPIFIDEVLREGWQPENKSFMGKNKIRRLKWPEFHWEFGKEIMEEVQQMIRYGVRGAIQISAYACGCDAVLKEFVEQAFKMSKIPFLYLIVDEQTGDAGLQTRLEAFIDTLN